LIKKGYIEASHKDKNGYERRNLWVCLGGKQNDNPPKQNDNPPKQNDNPISKQLNKHLKEGVEEVEGFNQISFINFLRSNFIKIPIELSNGYSYYFTSSGNLYTLDTNKKVSSSLAMDIYKRMYKQRLNLYGYLIDLKNKRFKNANRKNGFFNKKRGRNIHGF